MVDIELALDGFEQGLRSLAHDFILTEKESLITFDRSEITAFQSSWASCQVSGFTDHGMEFDDSIFWEAFCVAFWQIVSPHM